MDSSHISFIRAISLASKYPNKEAERDQKTADRITLLPFVSVFNCTEEFQICFTAAILKLPVVLVYT